MSQLPNLADTKDGVTFNIRTFNLLTFNHPLRIWWGHLAGYVGDTSRGMPGTPRGVCRGHLAGYAEGDLAGYVRVCGTTGRVYWEWAARVLGTCYL